jgi:hypothetical protein
LQHYLIEVLLPACSNGIRIVVEEIYVKKLKKLLLKKVTLRDLDEPAMEAMAGGNLTLAPICPLRTETCCKTSCV